MADWVTISSLATAGGTLVLAVATFSSVRSANRSARVAERSLLAGIRPVLMPSQLDDAPTRTDHHGNPPSLHHGGARPLRIVPLRPAYLPHHPTLGNYTSLTVGGLGIGRFFLNGLLISMATVICTVIIAGLAVFRLWRFAAARWSWRM